MILLGSTTAQLQVVTTGTQVLNINASAMDAPNTGGTAATPVAVANQSVNSATTTSIAGSPAASTTRNVKEFTVLNTDATNPASIQIKHLDGAGSPTTVALTPVFNLPAGNTLCYEDMVGFYQLDPSGNRISSSYGGGATAVYYAPTGVTGATTSTRYVGGTAAGAPTSSPAGGYNVGDWVVAQNGRVWVCVAAGSPGTWRCEVDVAVFRPQDYTAGNTYDPTGTNDSSTSFQAAWNAAQAYGARYVFLIPAGVFKCASLICSVSSAFQGAVVGAGMYATVIQPTTSTNELFTFAYANPLAPVGFTISDLSIANATPQTSGNAIDTNGGAYGAVSDLYIRNVYFQNMFVDINVGGGSSRVHIRDCSSTRVNAATGGVGILIADPAGTEIYIDGYTLVCSGTNRPAAGIQITQLGHAQFKDVFVTGAAIGFLVNPGASQTCSNFMLDSCTFDSSSTYGVYLNGSNTTAVIQALTFVNCQFSNSVGNSGVISLGTGSAKVDGVKFVGCRAVGNQTHGWQHGYGTGWIWDSCEARGNSVGGSGVSDGVNVASGVTPVSFVGGKYGGTVNAPTGGNQRYGIALAGGATVATVVGVDLNGNVTGPLLNSSTALVETMGCLGLPVLPAATAPATALSAGTNTYFAAASFPANQAQAGSCYVLEYDLTSTSATSNAVSLSNFWGTLGTTSDQAIVGPQAITALVATGVTKVRAGWLFKAVGATTTIYSWIEVLTNGVAPQVFSTSTNTTSKTTSACFAGIGVNSTNATLTASAFHWSRHGDRQ